GGQRVGGQATLGTGHAVEVGGHLDHGALHQRAHRQLHGLERPGPGRDVEDVAVEHVEHAQADFAAHHLLLVGDHVHHLEGAGVEVELCGPAGDVEVRARHLAG